MVHSREDTLIPAGKTDEPAAQWFYSTSDDLFYDGGGTREEAIAAGRNEHADGEPFEIGKGSFQGPWDKLFGDWDSLAEYIDDQNDDASYDDAFTVEAGLGKAEIEPLLAEINAVWQAFVAKHKPVSRQLLFLKGTREDVPGTAEWQAAQEASDPAPSVSPDADGGEAGINQTNQLNTGARDGRE